MLSVSERIVIDCPRLFTVACSNDLENWPQMMNDYASVEILRHEGWKIWFRLKHVNGSQWTSWRVIDPAGTFALAEKYEPKGPFKFMQHVWLYRDVDGGRTEMTWQMNFDVPADKQGREAEACEYLRGHAAANQQMMKAYIEQRYAAERGAVHGDSEPGLQ